MLFKYCVGIAKGEYKIHLKILLVITIFTFASVFISLPYEKYNGAILYLFYLPLIYLLFAMKKEFNIHQAMNYLLFGFILSSCLGFLTMVFPYYQYSVEIIRYRAFVDNPNYLYMRAIFLITYYMHLYLSNNLSHGKFIFIYLFCSFILLLTKSKTAICLLILFTFVFAILYLRRDFKKRIKIVAIALGALLILSLPMHNVINSIIQRFIANGQEDFITSLTTGRDKIWQAYLLEWASSPISILFGKGLLSHEVFVSSQNLTMASHNFYIFLLYRFGIIGCFALAYIGYLIIKEIYKKPVSITAWLPLIWFIVESFADNTFKCFNIMYLALSFMILFSEIKKKTKQKNVSSN